MTRRFDRFIAALSCVRVEDSRPRLSGQARAPVLHEFCNQYSATDGDLRGNAIRRRNLKRYLQEIDSIGSDTLLVGEAPSYRGGRLTGIPFVSERVMLDGVPIRSSPHHILGAGYRKATPGDSVSTEASATMVWEAIRELDPLPMLWNAFPFHPFQRRNPKTNRVPDAAELLIGQHFLRMLLRLFPFRRIVAIGNQAALSLTRMNVAHEKVRHPSQGGKRKFVEGMARLSHGTGWEDGMPRRKSQIQEIKEGRSMYERTYANRNQPYGPMPQLPTKNAVELSRVPSSAEEKYRGGRDE